MTPEQIIVIFEILYIISGAGMLYGGYLLYKTELPCSENILDFNDAVRIRRIQLRQYELGISEQLSTMQEEKYIELKRIDNKYANITILFSLSFWLHFFILFYIFNLRLTMPLYIASALVLYTGIKIYEIENSCTSFWISGYELDTVEALYKNINGILLDEKDEKNIEAYLRSIKSKERGRIAVYIGLIIHLIATIMHFIVTI